MKGRNGSSFEINIDTIEDISKEFDRLAVSCGFNEEDIFIAKIALFSNLSEIH